ncbi:HdeD family acid-resistance protein [Nakamurella silvestris]|nr:HdeD family acid-resistance protein [Nakamurella silvestris]
MTTIIKGIAGRYWWVVALRGFLLLLFGILALVWPGVTILVIATLFGIFSIMDGVAEIAHAMAIRSEGHKPTWPIVQGVFAIIAGVIALIWPGVTALAILLIIAVWALIGGIAGIVGSLASRRAGGSNWGWHLVFSILVLMFGISLIVNPGAGLVTLAAVVGIWGIITGIALLVAGFGARRFSRSPDVLL